MESSERTHILIWMTQDTKMWHIEIGNDSKRMHGFNNQNSLVNYDTWSLYV